MSKLKVSVSHTARSYLEKPEKMGEEEGRLERRKERGRREKRRRDSRTQFSRRKPFPITQVCSLVFHFSVVPCSA